MKICSYCKEEKAVNSFVHRGKIGHKCDDCWSKYKEEYDRKRREEKSKEIIEKKRSYRRGLREAILYHYGRSCAKCGFSDIRALVIDHVNDNGHEERKRFSNQESVFRNIVQSGFSSDYQILCANCNTIKEFERANNGRNT